MSSKDWELNNVERQHTHTHSCTLDDDVHQPLPAVPDAVRQKDLGHLHSNTEKIALYADRGGHD